jgi:hypothetical protein
MVLFISCGESSESHQGGEHEISSNKRSFYMGFTPWPYDATVSAIANTYALIQNSGDIVSHHLMVGIPWEEAFTKTQLPDNVEHDISSRLDQSAPGKVVVLSIDSLNTSRDDLPPNWGEHGEEPRSAPWKIRDFADREVATAYSNFALEMIARFNPSYFNYSPEVSELILNDDPILFDQFVIFAERVYRRIKAVHPDLPLLVSIALKSPDSAEASKIASRFSRISSFVDMVGISVYPYAFYEHADRGNPNNLPVNWLSQISSMAGNKPIAITETGWIAEDLMIPQYGLSVQSDIDKQSKYVSQLLATANDLSMEFVIWFTVVDYDALWNNVLARDNLSKLWKDTGLYDEYLNPRPAFDIWNQYYSRKQYHKQILLRPPQRKPQYPLTNTTVRSIFHERHIQ